MTMDFLVAVFETLAATDGDLIDQDAASFLPYLINQSGAKLESVRNSTHEICRLVCQCFPASKLFCYLLEGLKSKNSKQRTECLLEIGHLIEKHGMSVCATSTECSALVRLRSTLIAAPSGSSELWPVPAP